MVDQRAKLMVLSVPEKEGKLRLVGALDVLDSTRRSRIDKIFSLISGVRAVEEAPVAGKVDFEVGSGKDTVVLFALREACGGGSSRDESNEIPLEGGWEASLSETESSFASSVATESSVCSRMRSIFLKWS